LQPDAQPHGLVRQPVPRQAGKGLIDQAQQPDTTAFKAEQRAEQVQAAMMQTRWSLVKRIGNRID
jgi:hypothetical protein